MVSFSEPSDLDEWAKTFSALPEFEFEPDGGFLGMAAVRWADGSGSVGLLASGRFPGRLQVTAFRSEGAEFVAVNLWHGGNNGMVTTVILGDAPIRFVDTIDDGHFNTRLGPNGELVTEASVFGKFDQASVQASIVKERYYRVVNDAAKQVSYAERGSLHATSFAVDHYYEMLEHEPEQAREKLHPALLRDRVVLDPPTMWALNPRRSLATKQSMLREVPLFLDYRDEDPVGYWLVCWSAASRQWLLQSFRAAASPGPWDVDET